MKYKYTLVIIILLFPMGCIPKEDKREAILLEFKDGSLYCEGQHRVYRSFLSKKKNRIGIWKFYHPNGQLSSTSEYDKKGEITSFKEYNMDGQLIEVDIFNDETWILKDFYTTGVIKSETITTIKDDGDEITYYEKVTDYYPSGQIYFQKNYRDNIIHGEAKIWNENGELILEYEYDNGLIVPKDELSKWAPYKR